MKCLIIEDDIQLLNILRVQLEDRGITSDLFASMEDLISSGKHQFLDQYNFILADYNLPGEKGTKIIEIRDQLNIKTVIVVITGEPFVEGLSISENVFTIQKPFILDEILDGLS